MQGNRFFSFFLIVTGTIVGLAGTDLVLPAIPGLPDQLPGTVADAQLILASFTAGTAVGLIAFGELGARFNQKPLLIAALVVYSGFSFMAVEADTIKQIVVLRFFQGFGAAAPAVFAPGMIRALFDERSTMRALGLMGSLESVAPAFAPIIGLWLISLAGWQATFYATGIAALLLAVCWGFREIPGAKPDIKRGSYLSLLRSPVFLRYSLSQALTLGGLLAFVFGAPAVITLSLGGSMTDFITMQIIGITLFMIASNTTHLLADRIGQEATLYVGSILAAAGSSALVVYGLAVPHPKPEALWFLFAFVNLGLGIRGPGGFLLAILAAEDDDARGAALVMLMVFVITAAATAMLAPYITLGLVPLAGASAVLCISSILLMLTLPKLDRA